VNELPLVTQKWLATFPGEPSRFSQSLMACLFVSLYVGCPPKNWGCNRQINDELQG